jgi:hypothetical protein
MTSAAPMVATRVRYFVYSKSRRSGVIQRLGPLGHRRHADAVAEARALREASVGRGDNAYTYFVQRGSR